MVPNTSGDVSGDITSGDVSGEIVPSISGDTTENTSGDATPEISGDVSGDNDENILESIALDSSFEILKNKSLSATFEATIASGETVGYAITVQPTHGVIVQSGDTNPNYLYTPDEDYTGTDSFSFRLESGNKYSNSATVTVTIKEDTNDIIPFFYVDMQNHWANYSASHLAARGLVIGEEIGNRFYFCPNKTMTRGDFMLFLLAITESNVDASIDTSKVEFADSKKTPDWLLEAAKVAYSKGIIKGSSNNGKIYLNLDKPISRVEAAIMVSNVLDDKSSAENITYKDIANIPTWALSAVKNLSAYQIIQGDSNGTFRPNDILTRGEGAELSFKLLKQLELNDMNISGDLK
jgi:hypothetical protein